MIAYIILISLVFNSVNSTPICKRNEYNQLVCTSQDSKGWSGTIGNNCLKICYGSECHEKCYSPESNHNCDKAKFNPLNPFDRLEQPKDPGSLPSSSFSVSGKNWRDKFDWVLYEKNKKLAQNIRQEIASSSQSNIERIEKYLNPELDVYEAIWPYGTFEQRKSNYKFLVDEFSDLSNKVLDGYFHQEFSPLFFYTHSDPVGAYNQLVDKMNAHIEETSKQGERLKELEPRIKEFGEKSEIARHQILRHHKHDINYSDRLSAIETAKSSFKRAIDLYLGGQDSTAEVLEKIAWGLLDLSTSILPGISWVRDAYEAIFGLDFLTSEPISGAGRFLAMVGVVTGGGLTGKLGKTGVLNIMYQLGLGQTGHKQALLGFMAQAGNIFGSAETVLKSAKELRSTPGKAIITNSLYNSDTILRGTHGNAGLIPKDVAEKIVGKDFKSFDDFRGTVWKAVSESKYADHFGADGLSNMRVGKAPHAHDTQALGNRRAYELHHIEPINQGGSVYDLSNIMVVTPRFHKEVLEQGYHYGK